MDILRKKPYILFILPGVLLYTIITTYTILSSVPNSLTKWSGIGAREFVGINNYVKLFTDPRLSGVFFNALKNNVCFIISTMLFTVPLAILFAYLIYRKIPGHKAINALIF